MPVGRPNLLKPVIKMEQGKIFTREMLSPSACNVINFKTAYNIYSDGTISDKAGWGGARNLQISVAHGRDHI